MAAASQVAVQPKPSIVNKVLSFIDEAEADSNEMSRGEYVAKKKQFEGRKLKLRQEYRRKLAVLESEGKDIDADPGA